MEAFKGRSFKLILDENFLLSFTIRYGYFSIEKMGLFVQLFHTTGKFEKLGKKYVNEIGSC